MIGLAVATPQIATACMARLSNSYYADTGRPVVVTWSDGSDYHYHDYARADGVVQGGPFLAWGVSLSYCFANGEPCNDWDADGILNANDTHSDNDHCPNADEAPLGLDQLDPWDFYSVPFPPLFMDPSGVADNGVGLGQDVLALLYYDGISSGAPHYTADYDNNHVPDGFQYDRSYTGGNPGPPDGGIGQGTDVLAMLREVGWICN